MAGPEDERSHELGIKTLSSGWPLEGETVVVELVMAVLVVEVEAETCTLPSACCSSSFLGCDGAVASRLFRCSRSLRPAVFTSAVPLLSASGALLAPAPAVPAPASPRLSCASKVDALVGSTVGSCPSSAACLRPAPSPMGEYARASDELEE